MTLSSCCSAPVTDHLSQAYPERTSDELRGKTNWHICTKCEQACDLQPPAESGKVPKSVTLDSAVQTSEIEKQSDYVNPYAHIRSLESKLRLALDTIDRLATPSGFTAIGVIPEDQWGDELKARIDFAKARLSQIQLLTPHHERN